MTVPCLYRQVMGDDFGKLPLALQTFHSLAGKHLLNGWVHVDAPASTAAKCLAWCLGAPLGAQSGPIRFELEAGSSFEVWTRHFPSKTMKSRLSLAQSRVMEQLGPARLTFGLIRSADKLEMKLIRLQFFRIPCPAWLMPRIVAEETASACRLHFRVQASLPVLGVVASYRGHLEVPAEEDLQ